MWLKVVTLIDSGTHAMETLGPINVAESVTLIDSGTHAINRDFGPINTWLKVVTLIDSGTHAMETLGPINVAVL